jgi:hypothetical protein
MNIYFNDRFIWQPSAFNLFLVNINYSYIGTAHWDRQRKWPRGPISPTDPTDDDSIDSLEVVLGRLVEAVATSSGMACHVSIHHPQPSVDGRFSTARGELGSAVAHAVQHQPIAAAPASAAFSALTS